MIKIVELKSGMKVLVVKKNTDEKEIVKFLNDSGYRYFASLGEQPILIENATIDGSDIFLEGCGVDRQLEINMHQTCLVEKIKAEFQTEVFGRSGFEARNSLHIVDEIPEVTETVIKLGYPGVNESKEARRLIGDVYNPETNWQYIVEEIREFEVTFKDYSAINKRINELKAECEREYAEKFESEYGPIINGVEIGPNEKFDKLPSDYIIVYEERTKRTADHRRGRAHTYAVWAVKKGTKVCLR